MKKLILIAVLLLTTSQITFAQQAIAKIKFQEAEEAYAAKDYTDAITKLDEVEALLKVTSPKVMYLRIMAQSKIIEKQPSNDFKIIDDTRKLCAKYLKNYENVPENEDKYRDIYNVSEALNIYAKSEVDFNLERKKHEAEYGDKLNGMNDYDSELIGMDGISVTLNSVIKKHIGKTLVIIYLMNVGSLTSSGSSTGFHPLKWSKLQRTSPNTDFIFLSNSKNDLENINYINEIKADTYNFVHFDNFSKVTGIELKTVTYIVIDKNGEIVEHSNYDYRGNPLKNKY